MIHFIPILVISTTSLKRFGYSLVVPFCMLLAGCDSQSSTPVDISTYQSFADDDESDKSVDPSTESIDSKELSDEMTSEEGESLMAAARPTDDERKRRSPMIAEQNPNSALQATLIGDYVGAWPCSFCDGTSVTLNLFADGSVVKTSVYKNPESPKKPLIESGIYRQDNKLITIVYDEKYIESYEVQDNHLVMMSDGAPKIDYTLSRQ